MNEDEVRSSLSKSSNLCFSLSTFWAIPSLLWFNYQLQKACWFLNCLSSPFRFKPVYPTTYYTKWLEWLMDTSNQISAEVISSYLGSCLGKTTAGKYFSYTMIKSGKRIWWSEERKALAILLRSLTGNIHCWYIYIFLMVKI